MRTTLLWCCLMVISMEMWVYHCWRKTARCYVRELRRNTYMRLLRKSMWCSNVINYCCQSVFPYMLSIPTTGHGHAKSYNPIHAVEWMTATIQHEVILGNNTLAPFSVDDSTMNVSFNLCGVAFYQKIAAKICPMAYLLSAGGVYPVRVHLSYIHSHYFYSRLWVVTENL